MTPARAAPSVVEIEKEKRVTLGPCQASGRKSSAPVNDRPAHFSYIETVSEYPLIIRNRAPLFFRGFMLVFLSMTAIITYVSVRDRPPSGAGPFLFYILLVFWAVGLSALAYSLNQEASVVRVTDPRSIHVRRGGAFRRRDLWTDHARFWIEETSDSEGLPYFKLLMDAPGGSLAVQEGSSREYLETLEAKIGAATSGC